MTTAELPKLTGGEVVLTGDTFKHKDAIKAAGGKWVNGAWSIPADKASAVDSLPGVKAQAKAELIRGYVMDNMGRHLDRHPDGAEASRVLQAVADGKAWEWAGMDGWHNANARDIISGLAGKGRMADDQLIKQFRKLAGVS